MTRVASFCLMSWLLIVFPTLSYADGYSTIGGGGGGESKAGNVSPIFNSIKVNQQVNYKVTRLQKCFGTTNQPF